MARMSDVRGADAFRAARDQLLALRTDAERASREFEWPDVGDSFNWALDWFDEIAYGNERTALWIVEDYGSEAKYSFDDLRRRSNRVANWLEAQGIRRGDVVMLMLGNRRELWEAMLGALKLGAVILPTSVVLGPHDLDDRVERARVRLVIAEEADAAKFDNVLGSYRVAQVGAGLDGAAREAWLDFNDIYDASDAPVEKRTASDDAALIYFTSGTTSHPKIVVHSHRSYPVGHLSTMYWIGVEPGGVHLAISAAGWGKHAWSSFFAPWNAEATVFVVNYQRFDAALLLEQLDKAGATSFCAPPTVWRILVQHGKTEKPRAMRELLSAGEPLNPEVIARIHDWWGLEIRDGYGQTETTALIANSPGSVIKPGAMGHPLPGMNVVLLDPVTGAEGDEGEICLDMRGERPVNLMTEYLGSPAATDNAVRDGFFHTGDVAVRDENGCITFVGRTDDVFKSSDFKVSPFEVESILLEHDAVAEAGVVGAPDATKLNITKAYVTLAAGWEANRQTALEVLRHARASMPPYMRVRRLEFFDLPKTASGKIRRVELRNREVEAEGARLEGEWRDDDFPEIKRH